MSKKVIKRLMAKDGSTYQKNGETKNGYMRCGVLLQDDQNGELTIKITGLPIHFDGWLSTWELEGQSAVNKANNQQGGQQQAQQQNQQQAPQGGYDQNGPPF